MKKIETEQLAAYNSIDLYKPKYSDFVIRCTFFRSYFGIVNDFNPNDGMVSIVFEGTPRLLFTQTPDEVDGSIFLVNLKDIQQQRKGSWSMCQQINGQPVWYI